MRYLAHSLMGRAAASHPVHEVIFSAWQVVASCNLRNLRRRGRLQLAGCHQRLHLAPCSHVGQVLPAPDMTQGYRARTWSEDMDGRCRI